VTWLRALTAAAIVVVAVPAGILLYDIVEVTASQHQREWFGYLASLEAILILSVGIGVIHNLAASRVKGNGPPAESGAFPKVTGILIGADNRLSTSKLSAFAWTWVLAWAILALAIGDWVSAPAGWASFIKEGLQDQYLILLGGPFVALVGAKALVANGVASGSQVKPPAGEDEASPAARITQAFSDDGGQTDLIDTQYLVFGAVALVVFIVMFLRGSTAGLPQLPDILVALSSVGATAYIANKWTAEDAKPHIDRVMPDKAKPGETIVVYGTNLLSISQGGKALPPKGEVRVFFGGDAEVSLDLTSSTAQRSPSGSDYMRLKVPGPTAGGGGDHEVDLALRNAIGVFSDNTVPFTILA
jgi:hypothetical protein